MAAAPDDQIAELRRANFELHQRLGDALGREAATAEALRANEERHALVTQAVAEGIYDWDIDTNALWVSPRLIQIFGLTGGSLSAADWNEHIHRDDFEHYRTELRECFRGVTARLNSEYRIRHGDGQYRWIEDRGVPVRDSTGRAIRLVGAITDITERKESEQALRETSRFKEALLGDLNAVIDTIDYGVLFMGPDLRARVVNRAFRQMWGIPDAFIATGPTMADLMNYNRRTGLYNVPEAEFDSFIARRVEAIQAGDIAPIEMHRADGKTLRYGGVVLPDGGRLLTYFDITESKRREAELKETLEYQTATSDVLKVISRSTFDLQPVLQTVVETATRLCEADMGFLLRREGDEYRAGAAVGYTKEYEQFMRTNPLAVDRGSITGRVALEGRTVHIEDVTADPEYTLSESTTLAGQRTALGVPLLREGQPVGVIVLARKRVEAFTDKQIELVTTFADQAVIAIENTRLITDTREALEQQTATAEVLQVINSSPGDLAPVFDAVLDKSLRLCAAAFGFLWTWDGEQMHRLAFRGLPVELMEELRQPLEPPPGSIPERIITGERVVFDIDVLEGPRRSPTLARLGARSCVGVALRKDEKLLGGITIYRREVRPFAPKQLALLENFAAQAVIAMENARLITETREALEQQTATAQVLQVINASPGDLTPVFDAILEKAHRLCSVEYGSLQLYNGKNFRAVATRGYPERFDELLRQPYALEPDNPLRAVLDEKAPFEIPDVEATEARAPNPRSQAALALGVRSMLFVPLVKDNSLLGLISAGRTAVGRFTDKQIALLQNFAAQAVIAIENARLIIETREALEQQTATAEVLGVINASPGNLEPVFEAMVERAMRLCDAANGDLWTCDGDEFKPNAIYGDQEYVDWARKRRPFRAAAHTVAARMLSGENIIHIADCHKEDAYRQYAGYRELMDIARCRTLLTVALRKDDKLLGIISAYRSEVRPFSAKQIALLQNFAAQAVIAMENARLIAETREALDQQTATAEVLGVINSSPGDLGPVFDSILEKAHHICAVDFGSLQLYDGGKFHAVAVRGVAESLAHLLREPIEPLPDSPPSRLLFGESVVHILDIAESAKARRDDPRAQATAAHGLRTVLFVPLRKDTDLLGYIAAFRNEIRPFTDKQIALLQNFAAQAVIAIENARLITETREALEQQTATTEVLQVINASPGNLSPVFDAMLEKATRLCEAVRGQLATYDGEFFQFVAVHGEPGFTEEQFAMGPTRPEVGVTWPRIAAGERVVHMVDVLDTDLYRAGHEGARRFVHGGRDRTLLTVALRKDELLLGALTVYRQEVRPFSEKQIALLQNFAAQAVIAMENARLIIETREALEQQTATAEVLGVINSSPGNLDPVFDAMLEKATRLCAASFGILLTYDGERFRHAALRGIPPAYAMFMQEHPPIYGPDSAPGRLLGGEDLVHVLDMMDSDLYRSGEPNRRAIADLAGARTVVAVPLRKDDELMGAIVVFRQEVRAFSEKQLSLLQNFAAQAVVATDNARLITETREALEQQTATADILRIISGSATDVQPVFEAIVQRAVKLCEAEFAGVARFDDDGLLRLAATSNLCSEEAAAFHNLFPRPANRWVRYGEGIPGMPARQRRRRAIRPRL